MIDINIYSEYIWKEVNMNKVFLIGNLGKDPETRYTSSGVSVTNFSLATKEKWTDKQGQKQENTEWHKIVTWNRVAELCQEYLSKGSMVHVEGKVKTREWEDRDGNRRFTTEIIASAVTFLSKNNKQKPNNDESFDYGNAPIDDDDVPF